MAGARWADARSNTGPEPYASPSVEAATLGWIDWFNHHRLLEVNGDLPPMELEQAHYRHTTGLTETG